MANQYPVKDPVDLIYNGPSRANAIVGPVTNNGYPAKIGEVQGVERLDVDGLLATGLWSEPPKAPRPKKKVIKEGE